MEKKAFVYKRKSSEGDDRQAPSLESQDRSLRELIPDFSFYEIIDTFAEAKSAKMPDNRPQFSTMIERLEKGEAEFIICWALNRLARNAKEAGLLIYLVQSRGIKIITPFKRYDSESEVGAMYSEFSTSNTFIIDLQRNVRRGLTDKLKQGHVPILAPIGYQNTPEKKQGLRTIEIDNERFPLVRKMWDLLLTGQYTPPKILKVATNEWGLRQRNGRSLSRTQVYRLFTNIFYTGTYFTYAGEVHTNGNHQSMITIGEYDLAQKILGVKSKPQVATHEFAFTQWIKCVCSSSITADERLLKRCPKGNCRYKFNAKHSTCPKCGNIAPARIRYVCRYYCKRTKDHTCKQPSIQLSELEKQIDELLEKLEIPEDYATWALKKLRKEHEEESNTRQATLLSVQNTFNGVAKKLDNLLDKYLSEENRKGEIISDQQYLSLKKKLEEEKNHLEGQLKDISKRQDEWLDAAELAFNFAVHAREWFQKGTKEQKRAIAMCIVQNHATFSGMIR
jgi:site-specific DNA recombinase